MTRFTALDSWRGIAAIIIAVFHFPLAHSYFGRPLLGHMVVLVDFFFVLSGFVIAHCYLASLRDGPGFGHFAIRRFGRIYPLHIATLAGMLIIEWAFRSLEAIGMPNTHLHVAALFNYPALISNALLLHSLGLHETLTWNFPSWSISPLFYVYLLFGVLCLTRKSQISSIAVVIVALSLYILHQNKPNIDVTYDLGIFRCLAGFFTGVLAYKIYCAAPRLSISFRWLSFWEIAAVLIAGYYIRNYGMNKSSIYACLMLVPIILLFARSGGLLSLLLKTAPLVRLGQLSYSIYMIHVLVILLLARSLYLLDHYVPFSLFVDFNLGGNTIPMVSFGGTYLMDILILGYIALVLYLASTTHRLIEVPARQYFNRLSERYNNQPSADVNHDTAK